GNPASHKGRRRVSGRPLGRHAGRCPAAPCGHNEMGHTALSGYEQTQRNGFTSSNRITDQDTAPDEKCERFLTLPHAPVFRCPLDELITFLSQLREAAQALSSL